MKKILALVASLLGVVTVLYIYNYSETSNKHQSYAEFVKNNPYLQPSALSAKELEKLPKADRPDLAFEQNFIMTMDPALGYPTPEKLHTAYAELKAQKRKKSDTPLLVWQERGPGNVGGRTRAIMYDPNDPSENKVWAGAVTGGLWYNDNINSSSQPWTPVSDTWSNMSVSAIAYDPTNTQTFYVGTGEGLSNSLSFGHGQGIWKSTDGGSTWAMIPGSDNMTMINDLVVRDENGVGVLYVAVRNLDHRGFNADFTAEGLYRSTDGGASFTQVLPNLPGRSYPDAPADLEIGPDNRLWVGTINSNNGSDGGSILFSDDGLNFTRSYSSNFDRVEVAVAPSNKDYAYALVEGGSAVQRILRTTDGGNSWTSLSEPNDDDPGIPANDFSRGQAWYDLIAQVDPNDETKVVVGAINIHRSVDTGNTWQQVSHWYGGFGHPYVHADIHQLIYKKGSSSELLIGSDGGVAISTNFNSSNPFFSERNNRFNTVQFYAGALHPDAGVDYMLAGSQDNGTQQFTQAGLGNTNRAVGGDGAFCFIDKDSPRFQIASSQNGNWRRSFNGGNSFSRLHNGQEGRFINPGDYDDHLNILYAGKSASSITRIKNANFTPIIDDFRLRNSFSAPSAFKVSPYTKSRTVLFVGTGAGQLIKVDSANLQNGFVNSTDLTGSNFPTGYLSDIELGANEDEIIVTFSNYGINSVWYTNDGGQNWNNVQSNLPDMPVRGAIFNPRDYKVVALATELGVWMTQDITATNPTWVNVNNGLPNVRVDMIEVRESDFTIMATTHGRGVFTSVFQSGIGIDEQNVKSAATSVYPNPSRGQVSFEWNAWDNLPWQVQFIDLNGRVQLQTEMPRKAEGKQTIDLSGLKKGVYLVQARSGKKVHNSRLIVQ